MYIRAADGGFADFYLDIVVPRLRLGHVGQPEAFFRLKFH
jgi:hypothetical protein